MTMERACLTVLIWVVLLNGCGSEAEALHDGKSLTQWIAEANGPDRRGRFAAYSALGTYQKNKTAADALRQIARDDNRDAAERLSAGRNLFRVTGSADEVIDAVRPAIRREADSPDGFRAIRPAEELVFWLGERGKPLAPDLEYARQRIRGQDAASAARRAALEKLVRELR